MRLLAHPILLISALLLSTSRVSGADSNVEPVQTARLVRLCKIWGAVRYLHPYMGYKDVDWDAALVDALPKIDAAKDDAEYRKAVQSMLDRLADPMTRVVSKAPPPQGAHRGLKSNDRKNSPLTSWVGDDVLVIDLSGPISREKLFDPKTRTTLLTALEKASRVVLDLRGEDATGSREFVIEWISPLLPSGEVHGPAERYLVHSGYRPQTRGSSGSYFSAFQSTLPPAYPPAQKGKGKRTAFLITEETELPPIALALQDAGEAVLIAEGKAPSALGSTNRTLELDDLFEVHVRTSELMGPSGPLQVRLDAEVNAAASSGSKDPAMEKAVSLVRNPSKEAESAKSLNGAVSSRNVWRPDKRYEAMTFPSREYRLLALFRFWNVIHYFYPYKNLLDQDWDLVLPKFLPRFAAAQDEREYVLAVSEMAACIQDTHTHVIGSKELMRFFGEADAPIELRQIEGKPVVAYFLDPLAVKNSGVTVGDVVVSVDGEPVEKRMARLGKYIAGSNPDSHARSVLNRLLYGPEGSTLKLTVRGRDEKIREIALPRKVAYAALQPKPDGEVFRILEDGVGYCDLKRLTVGEIDAMLERLKNTRAIVFDLRGYPRGVIWTLAPRLNVKNAKHAASFQRMLVSGGSSIHEGDARFGFLQPIQNTQKWKYTGKTVTLIDERAISQSEHTGLFLEAACGTTFIGSRTAGANGDVTNLTLPGGLVVGFTGHDVRHADGRQLQRVGLTPHIEVRPTLAGFREGRDEVLERALRFLREGK